MTQLPPSAILDDVRFWKLKLSHQNRVQKLFLGPRWCCECLSCHHMDLTCGRKRSYNHTDLIHGRIIKWATHALPSCIVKSGKDAQIVFTIPIYHSNPSSSGFDDPRMLLALFKTHSIMVGDVKFQPWCEHYKSYQEINMELPVAAVSTKTFQWLIWVRFKNPNFHLGTTVPKSNHINSVTHMVFHNLLSTMCTIEII